MKGQDELRFVYIGDPARPSGGIADFPDRPQNLLAANAVMAVVYLHPNYGDNSNSETTESGPS
ncbi:PE-PPE domain-containing protein [Mycolicibacterium baixiangningiae]|uniref:PE-PPE domain-containing protein n=1 Tax=Mycolicibacterium baixiangningiae TaxID=2761578 RepID=UPI0018D07CB3|nr:PE-PPE domain-containing protein [Mycolicibacterium baixiangningiae]